MNTSLKTCFRCSATLPRTEFYRHPQMGDGLLGKCKSCCKTYAANRRLIPEAAERISLYEKERYQRPERRQYMDRHTADWQRRFPEKRKAHSILWSALKSGKIKPQPCEQCGMKAEAHHPDYGKPLEVRWLCRKHHMQHHRKHAAVL